MNNKQLLVSSTIFFALWIGSVWPRINSDENEPFHSYRISQRAEPVWGSLNGSQIDRIHEELSG